MDTLLDGANTTVTGGVSSVSVSEGGSVDISCTSTGIPLPTITWTLRNQDTPFNQDDIPTPVDASFVRNMDDTFDTTIISGSVVSTLHIVSAQYPAHDGEYQCIGSNSHAGQTFTQSATITVQVLGEVSLSEKTCYKCKFP